jgi:hypothetical protein
MLYVLEIRVPNQPDRVCGYCSPQPGDVVQSPVDARKFVLPADAHCWLDSYRNCFPTGLDYVPAPYEDEPEPPQNGFAGQTVTHWVTTQPDVRDSTVLP